MKDINYKRCENCKLMRNENCCGRGKICDEFEPVYNISDEEKMMWPGNRDRTSMSGVHYNSPGKRLRGEFSHYRDRSYYSYEYDTYGNRRYCGSNY